MATLIHFLAACLLFGPLAAVHLEEAGAPGSWLTQVDRKNAGRIGKGWLNR